MTKSTTQRPEGSASPAEGDAPDDEARREGVPPTVSSRPARPAGRARPSPSPIAVVVAAIALYLAVAEGVNRYLDAQVLPTAWTMIPKLHPRRIYRAMTPQWLRNAIGLSIGAVVGGARRRR